MRLRATCAPPASESPAWLASSHLSRWLTCNPAAIASPPAQRRVDSFSRCPRQLRAQSPSVHVGLALTLVAAEALTDTAGARPVSCFDRDADGGGQAPLVPRWFQHSCRLSSAGAVRSKSSMAGALRGDRAQRPKCSSPSAAAEPMASTSTCRGACGCLVSRSLSGEGAGTQQVVLEGRSMQVAQHSSMARPAPAGMHTGLRYCLPVCVTGIGSHTGAAQKHVSPRCYG